MAMDLHTGLSRTDSLPYRVFVVLRGLCAVVRLLATAVSALLLAVVGLPPNLPSLVRHLLVDEYRAGLTGAVDAEVIEEEEEEVLL